VENNHVLERAVFNGTDDLYLALRDRAAELGLSIEIEDRQSERGGTNIWIELLIAGAPAAVTVLFQEFADILRRKRPKGDR
jgi:hypothetical protein